VLVLRWLWWRMTAWGELGAIAASAIAIPLSLVAIPDAQAPLRLLVVALVSTVAAIAVSLAFRPASPGTLLAFYRRVRPPGAWGPVAALAGEPAGDPRRRLARGLAATALASVTVFGLLVGLATWLVDAPPPSWLPHREAWTALTLGAAILATPLWLRLGAMR
jgi:SSS family solute:Na+ symporter